MTTSVKKSSGSSCSNSSEPVEKSTACSLDRASSSISLNIAEGNGKYTSPDRCRFFDIARGSALECAACFDVLVAKKVFASDTMDMGKKILSEIVCMLVGLIKSNSEERLYEATQEYG